MNGQRPGKESEVRKIVATEYLSLDGVFQEPGEWSPVDCRRTKPNT